MEARDYEKLPSEAKAIIMGPGNRAYDELMAEVKRRRRYVKSIEEVRALTDAEMKGLSLTEELYKMRGE